MTTRERVADLLQRGLTDKEMARQLGRHESVVGYHVGRLIAATKSRNRTQAAVRLALDTRRAEGRATT